MPKTNKSNEQEDTEEEVDVEGSVKGNSDSKQTSDKEGAETDSEESSAPLSEEFQQRVMDLLDDATEHECEFIRTMVSKCEQKLREEKSDDVKIGDFPSTNKY